MDDEEGVSPGLSAAERRESTHTLGAIDPLPSLTLAGDDTCLSPSTSS